MSKITHEEASRKSLDTADSLVRCPRCGMTGAHLEWLRIHLILTCRGKSPTKETP